MRHILISIGVWLLSYGVWAYPVTGTFSSTTACPAYISKNKKTNPDQLIISAQKEYSIIEVNFLKHPTWLRIKVPDNKASLRWISIQCGIANYYPWEQEEGRCNLTPGLADSQILAFSWLPGFCRTYGKEVGKPECQPQANAIFAADHLSLHGLWPNQKNCGVHYGFCGVEQKTHPCEYLPVFFNPSTAQALQTAMPSYAFGSCLERHEWYKHGSCQALDADNYFSSAIRLLQEANQSPFGLLLSRNVGQTLPRARLENAIKQSFGKEAVKKVYLGCHGGILVDVWLQLPAQITQEDSLKSLLQKASNDYSATGCPKDVFIAGFK